MSSWRMAPISPTRGHCIEWISADGSPLMPPMGYHYYASLADGDLHALVAYLRSLKPLGAGTNE
jgi:hypothetical protein